MRRFIIQLLFLLVALPSSNAFSPASSLIPKARISHQYVPRRVNFVSTHLFEKKKSSNKSSSDDEEDGDTPNLDVHVDPLVRSASLLMRRLSWFSWWAQLILTTISSVTLLFARNVITRATLTVANTGGAATTASAGATAAAMPNFVLAGSAIILSVASILWTGASRRLSRRLLKRPTTKLQAANMLRKDINVGVTLNLLGMFCTILGAEQIVGALAIKVLTTASYRATLLDASPSGMLQPLDILVVQANTNTLFSHFCSIAAFLYLTKLIDMLDPPSVVGNERQGR